MFFNEVPNLVDNFFFCGYFLISVELFVYCPSSSSSGTNKTVLGSYFFVVDYHIQKTKHLIPNYLRYSNQILNKMKRLAPFPPGAKIFSANAISMYPSINNDDGIATV